MTLLLHGYHSRSCELTSPDEAGRRFDEQIEMVMRHRCRGQGPAEGSVLRVDIDVGVGRAAVRWLPDGNYAADLDSDTPITVYESPTTGLRVSARGSSIGGGTPITS